jgi:hypothetical protein
MSKGRNLMPTKANPESAGAASRFVSIVRRHRAQALVDLRSPPMPTAYS